ncbi:hypothetical protein D3C78_1446850 [compost metagenome]
MWTKGVVTSTKEGWDAMFKLRRHYAAQPECKALFDSIYNAIKSSKTEYLEEGEWHMPYVHKDYIQLGLSGKRQEVYLLKADDHPCKGIPLEDAIKISASCCAQVSYRRLDDSLDKAIKIYDMLNLPEDGVYPDDPPHFSPTEHIAMAAELFPEDSYLSGNFHSNDFMQYRKLLEQGIEKEYIDV